MGVVFSKFHKHYVVGMVDIVESTKLISNFSVDETDAFFTVFLSHYNECIERAGAEVVKNVGDGFLFYMKESRDMTREKIQSVITCGNDIISFLPELNQKLKEQKLPDINVRVSMSYGPVSVMLNTDGNVIDIFGSTVSTCVKMNKMAEINGVLFGNTLASYVQEIAPMKQTGVFTLDKNLSFPVFALE